MLNKLHYNHLGMEKTKNRAREIIFWPGMSKQIDHNIFNCETRLKLQKSNEKETLINIEVPDGPWKTVGADLFYFQGNYYLLLIDYFSKFIEMQILPDQSSSTTVNILKSMFARHGIPVQLRSDGGPQFDCKNMKDFAKLYHVRVQNGKHWTPAIVTNQNKQPRQYEIIKEDGRRLKRNRVHLRKDTETQNFSFVPDFDEMLYSVNDNVTQNNYFQNTEYDQFNNMDITHNETLNNTLILNDNIPDLNIINPEVTNRTNIINQNSRPQRNVKKPNYLNEYVTNF